MERGRSIAAGIRARLRSLLGRNESGSAPAVESTGGTDRPDGFRLGPLYTGYISVEGDGSRAIDEHNVHVTVDPSEVVLPGDFAPWRAECESSAAARGVWNGPRYAVVSCAVSRTRDREDPILSLQLKYSDYLNFLTTQQLDREFADGSTPRSRYLASRPITEHPDFMANSFGAHVAVVTADDKLVLARRSAKVTVQPGLWSAAVAEGLSRSIDGSAETPPSIYDLARRGMDEELALDVEDYTLELLSVGLATTVHQWVALFAARLESLTWSALSDRLSRGSADPWEHSAHAVVDFAPRPVLTRMLEAGRSDGWTPAAVPALYYVLVRRFGRGRVDRQLESMLRRP
jgi:hypothetical protein